jgi:hypothetical protein
MLPEQTRRFNGVDEAFLPPGGFIADTVHQSVMYPAERDRELVARLAP